MCCKNPCLVFPEAEKSLTHYCFPHIRIKCAEWIVHQHDLSIWEDGSCDADSCFLPSREGNPFLSNQSKVSILKRLDVLPKLTEVDRLAIEVLVHWKPKENVIPDSHALNPWILVNRWERFLPFVWEIGHGRLLWGGESTGKKPPVLIIRLNWL